jgi:hypothetical protein
MKLYSIKGTFFTLSTVSLLSVALPSFAVGVRPLPITVFNSFGAGGSFNSAIVWGVTGVNISNGYRGQAELFVPSNSGYLDIVQLETYHVGGSNLGNFAIAQDNGSGLPGTILESWSNVANPSGLLTLTSAVDPFLQAGQTYWLTDEPANASSDNGWYQNNQNIPPAAYENSPGGWNPIPNVETAGVFSVTVIPVPEPSTVGIFVLGFLCLGGFLKLDLYKLQK